MWGWAMGWFSLNLMLLLGHLGTSLKFPSKQCVALQNGNLSPRTH